MFGSQETRGCCIECLEINDLFHFNPDKDILFFAQLDHDLKQWLASTDKW